MHHPSAYFEIVYAHPHGQPAATAFRLRRLPLGSVRTHRGRTIQLVPKANAERRTRHGLGYVDLHDTPLARFHLDPDLEQDLARALTALAIVTGASAMDDGDRQADGGAREHRRQPVPSLTAATAAIGWNGGVTPLSNRQLGPYHVYRVLKCLAFTIKVRQSILECLNATLGQVGRRLELPMQVKLGHVVTLKDVDEALADLQRGRRTINELARWALM